MCKYINNERVISMKNSTYQQNEIKFCCIVWGTLLAWPAKWVGDTQKGQLLGDIYLAALNWVIFLKLDLSSKSKCPFKFPGFLRSKRIQVIKI